MTDNANTPADIINKIMQTAKAALPDSLSNDVRDNVRAAIQEVLSDLDVVTREELEIQQQVLQKTRAQLTEMEEMVRKLEERLN